MDRKKNGNGIARRAIVAAGLGLALVGLVALTAQARGPGTWGREASPDRAVARMTEQLDLTAEQQAEVRQIFAETFEKRREIREEARRKAEALREETDARLSGTLTPEQMTKLRSLREERRDRRRDGGRWPGGKGDGPSPARPGDTR